MNQALAFKVHTAVIEKVPVTAMLAGREIAAQVDGLVVELVSEDGTMAHTFRMIPEDVPGALAAFAHDAAVTVTLSVGDEPAKA